MGIVVTIGCDLGQKRDPTAIAVVERQQRPRPVEVEASVSGGMTFLSERTSTEEHFLARHLERLPLGTGYPQVAERVGEVCAAVAARTGERPSLYVDATGVGQPVVDVLRDAGVPAQLVPVYFSYGDRLGWSNDGSVSLGKAFLVSRLQALFQGDQLHLPDTQEARALERELKDYEIRVDENANDRYGAFKTGTHDDLVTALGLAVVVRPRWNWDAV